MNMKYAEIKENDTVNCMEGITVSLFVSGCPHHCKGCFNQITWNPNYGTEIEIDELCKKLNDYINAYEIERSFSVLGGEPLAVYNRKNVNYIIHKIREYNPNIVVYLWSGYTLQELQKMNDSDINDILKNIDYFIDGRFEEDKKVFNLKMRGSLNQNIYQRINGKLSLINV